LCAIGSTGLRNKKSIYSMFEERNGEDELRTLLMMESKLFMGLLIQKYY
jgi:hypothetical protein